MKLPKSYIDFKLKYNGGYPSLSAFGDPYEDGVNIEVFACVNLNYDREVYDNDVLISVNDLIDTHQVLENNNEIYAS